MNELVSIIVPVYKVQNYLKKCVNSIRNQTYKNLEIILVEDGSPDKSGELCDRLAGRDDRIVVLHKKNGGVSSARNAGLEIARGKYVIFVDSDDWLPPNGVSDLVRAVSEHNSDFAFGTAVQVGVTRMAKVQELEDLSFGLEKAAELLKYIPMLRNPWAKIYSLQIIRDYNLRFIEKMAYGEDGTFVWQYLAKCNHFAITKSVVYYYSLLNLTNACSKYYPEVNEWIMVWIKVVLDFISDHVHREGELEKIRYDFVMKELWALCSYFTSRDKLDARTAVEKIREGCNMCKEFLPAEVLDTKDEFANMVFHEKYDKIYASFRNNTEKSSSCKAFLRKILVRMKQIYVYGICAGKN